MDGKLWMRAAPRPTAEEERELARRRPHRPPGDAHAARAAWEADPAAQAAWRGWLASDARATLILSVGPLARKLAMGRFGRSFGEDAAAQAALIAVQAVDNFDPAMGVRLTTFVARCLGVLLARDLYGTGRAIHVPEYLRAAALLPPAPGEHRHVASARAVLRVPSLSALEGAGGRFDTPGPGDDGDDGDDWGEVLAAVGRLEPRLARVVRARHLPAPGEPPATLAAIGEEMGLTKERARQLLARAHRRLREDIESRATPGPTRHHHHHEGGGPC